jgi:hypothetical protein
MQAAVTDTLGVGYHRAIAQHQGTILKRIVTTTPTANVSGSPSDRCNQPRALGRLIGGQAAGDRRDTRICS